MADFCKQCSINLFGEDSKDLALGPLPPGYYWYVICEGCGFIQVDALGRCVTCHLLKGTPGHGT